MTRNHIGVDLSMHFLDICDPLRRLTTRVANEPKAIAAWIARLGLRAHALRPTNRRDAGRLASAGSKRVSCALWQEAGQCRP